MSRPATRADQAIALRNSGLGVSAIARQMNIKPSSALSLISGAVGNADNGAHYRAMAHSSERLRLAILTYLKTRNAGAV